MGKLYPPVVEGKLPAFTGATLVVPFSMNRAVGTADVRALQVQVKYINRDDILFTKTSTSHNCNLNCYASFTLTTAERQKLKVGQFYRIQLAYVDSEAAIGYYSSVGVAKYTTRPTVKINNLETTTSNRHCYEYTGVYHQDGDSSEKLYSSNLLLVDSDYNVIYQSEEVIHSAGNDILPNEATELFTIPFELDTKKRYRMRWSVTTVNNLTVSTPEYRITASNSGGVEFQAVTDLFVNVTSNFSRGTVDITLAHQNPEIKVLKGMFRICRSEYKEPYEWKFIRNVFMTNEPIRDVLIPDYTIEQGKTYIYSIQQFNNSDIFSNRSISRPITIDFEDYYLIDPERQLKIRYNPQISTMSNQIVENKTDTIGSRYPFITRSGVVHYKNFSLSGLISYHMDEDQDFMKWSDLGFSNLTQKRFMTSVPSSNELMGVLPSHNLTPENIVAERIFKLEVLEWLNNGKPKILKTATEGSYLVIIMNVSMSPNDTLGRMLHSFSCQAHEIGPYDYDHLVSYGFFDSANRNDKLIVPQWVTTEFAHYDNVTGQVQYVSGNLIQEGGSVTDIDIRNVEPGTKILIGDEWVVIGATGAYHAHVTKPITTIMLPEGYEGDGVLTYQTEGPLRTDFDLIQDYRDSYIVGKQFIGTKQDELLMGLSNLRDVCVDVLGVRITKRTIIDVYTLKLTNAIHEIPSPTAIYYYDANGTDMVPRDTSLTRGWSYDWTNPTTLFRIHWLSYSENEQHDRTYYSSRIVTYDSINYEDGSVSEVSELYYMPVIGDITDQDKDGAVALQFTEDTGYFYDPNQRMIVENTYDIYTTGLGYYRDNNRVQMEYVNVDDKEYLDLDPSFKPCVIYPGDGVIVDVTYSSQSVIYSYETNKHLNVASAKATYDEAVEQYTRFTQFGRFSKDDSKTLPISYIELNNVRDNYVNVNYVTGAGRSNPAVWKKRQEYTDILKARVDSTYKSFIEALQTAYDSDLTRG